MYSDNELVMISALQHYVFCKRQCALIHLEQAWEENRLTAEGRIIHDRVDQPRTESRRDVCFATAVRIRSYELGLTGVMDMLELHKFAGASDDAGQTIAVRIPGRIGLWSPFPIEYKRGKPKSHHADEIQLCAQTRCLEEMLDVFIPAGALFYGQTRRRTDVAFTSELRLLTEQTAQAVHSLLSEGVTPSAIYEKRCENCSLIGLCHPKSVGAGKPAKAWIDAQVAAMCNVTR